MELKAVITKAIQDNFSEFTEDQAEAVIEAIKQEGFLKAPEWISVKNKLPSENILVLGMSQTRSNIFNFYDVMALDEFEEADITHWMPLPDAPQESADEL